MESSTITSTAIPRITDHFRALDDTGWYASAYELHLATTVGETVHFPSHQMDVHNRHVPV